MIDGKVLVTGAGGFIGHHLVRALGERGATVRALDRAPARRPPEHTDVVVADVRDEAAVDAAVVGTEVVFHLASVVGVGRYLTSQVDVVEGIVLGTRNVLAAAERHGARVVVVSTSEVFGKNAAVPWDEGSDRVLGPTSRARWSYASAKGAAEHLTFGYHAERGLDVSIVRPFNAYGPHQRPDFILPLAVHRLLRGLPVPLHAPGTQTRCFTEIADIVEGIAAAAGPVAVGRAFNLGSPVEVSVADAVGIVARVAGVEPVVEHVEPRASLGPAFEDLSRRVPDVAAAAEILGWSATVSLEEGVDRLISWARRNPWWLESSPPGDR